DRLRRVTVLVPDQVIRLSWHLFPFTGPRITEPHCLASAVTAGGRGALAGPALAAPPRLGRAWGAPGSDGDRPPAVEVDAAGEHLLEPVWPIVWWIWAHQLRLPSAQQG